MGIFDLFRKKSALQKEFESSVSQVFGSKKEADKWYNKGSRMAQSKRYKEAVDCYTMALKIDPKDTEALSNKGRALEELKRYKEALECYNQILKINPDDLLAQNNRGIAQVLSGKDKQASKKLLIMLKSQQRY